MRQAIGRSGQSGEIMRAPILWRKVHYWLAIAAALPVLIFLGTGLLLQVK
jgi:hypothetical protein